MTFCLQCKLKAFAFYPQGKRITALALNTAKRLVAFTEYKSPHPIKFVFKINLIVNDVLGLWYHLDPETHNITITIAVTVNITIIITIIIATIKVWREALIDCLRPRNTQEAEDSQMCRCSQWEPHIAQIFILFTLFTILNNNNFPQSLKVTQLWASRSAMTQSIY